MINRQTDKIDRRHHKDRMVFLSDYIDRDKNPKGVSDFILTSIYCSSNAEGLLGGYNFIVCVLGNMAVQK